ncbi:hypothetical protein [Epilithonimonas hungarica]|uniref:Uncharacterized protein n=1 Tax=Epilithonimonas hungarica TaxID=454006 RepID=A0A1G7MS44_9FLAO|nr:hypothetical protein [Epilithonimonas hungarica]SDF64582.1 hypothetical protein SAMN05421825_1808 [Epilithonimonas hungarica]
MDFIQYLQNWTKADINQGKWMIGIAILIILPICILFIQTSNSLQKGMLIPLCLLLLMNISYGSYLLISKSKHAEQTSKSFQLKPKETTENEVAKIKADDKSYTMTKYAWAGLLILSVICFFIFNKDYFRGLSLGFAIMFMGMLVIDVFLHHSLKLYLLNVIK